MIRLMLLIFGLTDAQVENLALKGLGQEDTWRFIVAVNRPVGNQNYGPPVYMYIGNRLKPGYYQIKLVKGTVIWEKINVP